MSQRNPMNDRYTTDDRKGQTRKSAATMKPKSKAASTVHVQSTTKTKQQKKAEQKKAQEAKAKAKADAIREAIKEEMVRQNTEELVAGAYIVRFTNLISNRFDSTTFKRLYADLYKDFTKPVSCRRFSVSC